MSSVSLLDLPMRVHDAKSVALVEAALSRAEARGLDLPGAQDSDARLSLSKQLIESIRRVQYVVQIPTRSLSNSRKDPASELFDPLRAASLWISSGNIDEAAWLIFLSTHFGQRVETKWSLTRAFYRGDEDGAWTWERASSNTDSLLSWLDQNVKLLRAAGRFGNHRKYESFDAYSQNGTGAALSTYIDWVTKNGGHHQLFSRAVNETDGNSELMFAWLYGEMTGVRRFGRMGKFDFLCMLGKLRVVNVWPGSMFVSESTGPLRGAKVLFGDDKSPAQIEDAVRILDNEMRVGMQVFEDAICNWQKSTHEFKPFRG